MADYNLGTAQGKIKVDYDGKGVDAAKRDMGGLSKSATSSQKALKQTGDAAGVAGGAIAVGFGLAAKVAIDFEKQISAIGAVSGATKEELELFRKKALQLGADTSFSATQAALAMEELAKAGLGTDDILNGAADAAVALAAAGGVELPEAAELAADAMTSFSLSAQDLPKIADKIAGAANASSINVSQFGQSLKQVGAVANLAGISFEETAQAIAIMGANGIKGSDAGTSLKTMLSNLLPTTVRQKEVMRDLGILTKEGGNAFLDASGKMKSLADISQILQNVTENLTPAQKQLALETIFGSDAIRAAAILTKAGAKGFEDMGKAMGKVTAEEVAAARLDNTAGAIEQLKGSAETAAISLATALLPAITKLAQFLTKLANAFNSLSPRTKSIITIVALVTAGILLLVFTVIKIISAVKAFIIVWQALNLSFLASPIGLIIIAIVALVAIIVIIATKTQWFQKIWEVVWGAIRKAASAVAEWFSGTLVPFFKKAWDKLAGFFSAAWDVIKAALDFIVEGIKAWFDVVRTVFNIVATPFKVAFKAIAYAVETAWIVVSAIFAVWRTVMGAIFAPVLKVIGKLFEYWWGYISWVVEKVLGFIIPLVTKAINTVKDILDGAMNLIVKLWNAWWSRFSDGVQKVWNFIKPFIDGAIKFIKGLIETQIKIIQGVWNVAWNAIKFVIETTWNAIKRNVTTAVNAVVSVMNGIKKIVDNVRKFFGQLKDAANGGTASLISFVAGIPGRVASAIGNLGKLLYQKGRDLVQGLINGLKSMLGNLRDAAGSLIGPLARFLPGSPAKEGPLAGKGYVLKRGQRMGADFAAGITLGARDAVDAARRMVGTLSGELPANNQTIVASATSGTTPVNVAPVVQPAAASGRTVTIGNLNINGTWDLGDASVPRRFVSRLHDALDRYEKGFR